MPRLFISYRRYDSTDVTGRLADQLKSRFGDGGVFMDVDAIPPGVDFRQHLSEAVNQCQVVLAIIGDRWLNAAYEDGPHKGQRRLDDPLDWVRIEIECALTRGIPVVPVLVATATMPRQADLPEGLKDLAHRNAAEVRSGADFHGHMQRLIQGLEELLDKKRQLQADFQKTLDLADKDPDMALIRARMALERMVRDVYERHYQEPAGPRPLENLLGRLVRDGFFPDRLSNFASTITKLGHFGTPGSQARSTAADVQQSLTPLMEVLKWYFEVEQPDAVGPVNSHKTIKDAQTGISPASPPASIAVIPKGLRSFDAQDADFFLGLLPGPRDKEGLPESIRFWKHRIETTEELTFSVGVIFGPSGCGKSSLVKAGLFPRLAKNVLSIYVEATASDTEARLLKGLHRSCPALLENTSLIDALAALGRGQCLPPNKKLIVVLDQFEQWLHARGSYADAELVQALRHCDGDRVQCIVMVRDDFGMAAARFMGALDIPIVQGQNFTTVDLFDLIHSRKVLAEFGRAFGRLPLNLSNCAKEQEAFLDQAVAGLAQDGKVVSVRLALFAEMVKGKPWIPATLKEVGGMEGVGVTFLEETFAASTAPPQYRLHQKAVLSVLKALLPETWTQIKGQMRSAEELQAASGYADHPDDFQQLLRILDGELRLITPTDLEGIDSGSRSDPRFTGQRYYQLTHDYLVPSIREWLIRKQKETRQGRAELRLAVWSSVWNSKPENRNLPSWWEWAGIRLLTQKKDWTPPQRKMMRKATKYQVVRGAILSAILAVGTITSWLIRDRIVERENADNATDMVGRLLVAKVTEVQKIISEIDQYRFWADPLLKEQYARSADGSAQKLHTSLALLAVDKGQVNYLYGRLLNADPGDVSVILDAIAPHQKELVENLWQIAERPAKGRESERLRAASALAAYDPESPRWATILSPVANDLVAVPAVYLATWLEALRPVRANLLAPLAAIYRDGLRRDAERSLATDILADYAADDAKFLSDLLMDGDEQQFSALYPKLKNRGDDSLTYLLDEISKPLQPDAKDEIKESLAKRQANAAVALLRMNQSGKVWPLLKHSPDPRVRSYLIHRFAPLGGDPEDIIRQLDAESDVTILRALLLSLGEYDEKDLSLELRETLLPKLQKLYLTVPDPGLHAAAEWLLQTWKQEAWLKQATDRWAQDKTEREKRLPEIESIAATTKSPGWYVNSQGQTMVVVPGPVEFMMGSPPDEDKREASESQHKRRIGRTFAMIATPVTKEQFLRFRPEFSHSEMRRYPYPTCPIGGVTWYDAAAYCNWLSEQEGIDPQEWCYEMNSEGQVANLKERYLRLKGYRLPTEAETEFATRAGSITNRYYGAAEELLPKYAWYVKNSAEKTSPVATKKPNDFGLFDMHGNIWCWCQDTFKEYPQSPEGKAAEDIEDALTVNTQASRVWRGGSFNSRASLVRSALRSDHVPSYWLNVAGFRVARTVSAE